MLCIIFGIFEYYIFIIMLHFVLYYFDDIYVSHIICNMLLYCHLYVSLIDQIC